SARGSSLASRAVHAPRRTKTRQTPLTEPELIGGPEKRDISVVDYDHSWPDLYEQHRAGIAMALGSKAIRIEHVGSTSVPGLAAKAIIDIQLSVRDVEDEATYLP